MELKLEKLNNSYSVKTDSGKEIGNFQLDSDGFYYFWEDSQLSGCWAAHTLRELSSLLDEVNKEFNYEVDEYFDLLRRNEEEHSEDFIEYTLS